MENHVNQSPAIPKWSALLIEAVTKPGLIMKAYSAFHAYSIGNQILALVQCQMRGLQPGPINTFPKWKDLGRFVKRGERALSLCMPITCKRREEDSDDEHTFTSFVYKARWFVLSQTDGQELEPITVPEWNAERAIAALSIERIPFDHTDGNVQGFARLCCRQHKLCLCGQVSYVALSFSSQLSAANQRTERHISSRLRARAGTSLALYLASIASIVWSPLLHKFAGALHFHLESVSA